MPSSLPLLVITLTVWTFVRNSTALHCWVCNDKSTLKECHAQYGEMLKCPNPDDVCQNDARTANGRRIITKGCKQRSACQTEVRQNRDKNQCGRKTRNLVCRCCCSSSGCNSKESGCLPPPPPCQKLRNPVNGFADCPGEIRFQSRCRYRCKNGFRRIGQEYTTCARTQKGSKKGTWNLKKPVRCEKVIVKCDPPRKAPSNGFLTCQNSKEYKSYPTFNFQGSKCSYGCNKHYYLTGRRFTRCTVTAQWSNQQQPKCVKGQCEQPKTDPNRVITCSDGHNFGSECIFSCKNGFNLIGEIKSTCQQTGQSSSGSWTNALPECAKILCHPRLTAPSNGKVACSNSNAKGSICTYSCNDGFDLDGSTELTSSATCRDDNDGDAIGTWSISPATCSRIKCEPSFKDPNGGQVSCTNGNHYGSKCSFSCNSDYDLTSTTDSIWVSTCEDDKNGDPIGQWSEVAADCKAVTCEPAFIEEITEDISCTKGNGKNSICTLSCKTDFVLEGTITRYETSKCLPPKDGSAKGRWTRVKKPECIPIACPLLPPLENGVAICSFFNMKGSFCVFYCEDGFDRIGASYMMCQKGKEEGSPVGEWTATQPTCRLGQCSIPKFNRETVNENCSPPTGYLSSEYRVGTVCTYTCKDNSYYMLPNTGSEPILSRRVTSECDIEKRWTSSVPRCLHKTCVPQLQPPHSGYTPKCTNGNVFGSVCTFSCQEKHAPSHDRPLVCMHDGDNDQYGRWSENSPKCERSHCNDFGSVQHGRLVCSNGTKIGSICDLECIDRYTIKRYDSTECTPSAVWSRRRENYFCCVPCLFNSRIKIAMAFDKSTLKNPADWQLMIGFTKSYLTMMIQNRLQVSFSGFGYATDIKVGKEIPMRRLRNMRDVDTAMRQLQQMRISGKQFSTVEALQHINEVIYKKLDRKREHFIILITDGRSSQDFQAISQAIRNRGINILATGIKVNQVGRKKLLQISGVESNVFTTEKISDMMLVPAKIFEISRTTGCTTASKSQSCP